MFDLLRSEIKRLGLFYIRDYIGFEGLLGVVGDWYDRQISFANTNYFFSVVLRKSVTNNLSILGEISIVEILI